MPFILCGCVYQSAMAMPSVLRALTVFFVLAVLAADHAEGRHHQPVCPSFSCGPLGIVSLPFRQASDPPGCGYQSHEIVCSDSKATIRIDNATYYVSAINYSDSTFWVIDADLDFNSCPLPRWNRPHRPLPWWNRRYDPSSPRNMEVELAPVAYSQACFVKCSRVVKDNGFYMPVTCLSTNDSFVYVLTGWSSYMGYLEPSCGYLAMTPWPWDSGELHNSSYVDVVKSMRRGFAVRFPWRYDRGFNQCITNRFRYFERPEYYGESIKERIKEHILFILTVDLYFLPCALEVVGYNYAFNYIIAGIWFVKWIAGNSEFCALSCSFFIITSTHPCNHYILCKLFYAVLCRFVLAPLSVLIFLTYRYWKTRITIDAVEKFLRVQQMLGPTRYAYTDITAITSHFRDKLGQGGYGSVYKGVLLPGKVHVAVKMLEGNSNCNGEDFISEVSTIGRIHHINVVRLVGFCSEEMRRALVYEYMPRGSLDKYIFSAEKSFSWDKLNDIASGIARGINYLHQGCDMQILHFDIKPHNILLDSNFIPKVADFGLAKLYPRGNSFVPLSALRGTVGYIAPEMISRSFGVISSKSDVYSFGMLLLEMAGGRRNADPNAANSSQAYYPSWVYDRLTEQEVGEISIVDNMHELEKKLCIVGLWCIQMKSHDRPTMSEVIEMLEAGVDGLQMPSRPFFCDEEHIHIEDSYHCSSELTAISEEE